MTQRMKDTFETVAFWGQTASFIFAMFVLLAILIAASLGMVVALIAPQDLLWRFQ